MIRVDYANTVDTSDGYIVSLVCSTTRGRRPTATATGNCATRDVTLTTAPGFDSMTGLGSVGRRFIATLSRF